MPRLQCRARGGLYVPFPVSASTAAALALDLVLGWNNGTFPSDLTDSRPMLFELQPLIDKVWQHCQDKGTLRRTVTLKVKFADFELISRSRTLPGKIWQCIFMRTPSGGLRAISSSPARRYQPARPNVSNGLL